MKFNVYLAKNAVWLACLVLGSVLITGVNIWIVDQIMAQSVSPIANALKIGFCQLRLLWNPGLVFGLMSHWSTGLLSLCSLGILAYILYFHHSHQLSRAAISFIVIGGLGNVLLRLWYTAVPDYLYCPVNSAYFTMPSSNINDIFIFTGLLWLLVQFIISFINNKK